MEYNSTCFGQSLCPKSGVFHCTHSNGICADSLRGGSERILHASKNKFEKLVHLVGIIMNTLNCCFAYEADRTTHTRESCIAACSVPGNVSQMFNNFWSSTLQVPQIYFWVTCSLTTHNLHEAVKVKVKVHPIPHHEGPDGETMYSFIFP